MILVVVLGLVALACFWLACMSLSRLDGNMTMRRCFGPECYDAYPLRRLIWLSVGFGSGSVVGASALIWNL